MVSTNQEEKIEKIIKSSGNNFHYKVAEYFRSKDWEVLVSPYYTDNYTDKPREIDLIAEKNYPCKNNWGNWVGYVNVRLFIECKYIVDEVVFWFDKKDKTRALDQLLKDTPLGDPNSWSMTNKHRYLQDEDVAKLFASNKTSESEVFYKTTTQCLNALVSNKSHPSITQVHNPIYVAQLNYPVITCNSFDKLFRYNEKKPSNIESNFMVEMNYAYYDKNKNSQNEFFLIDVSAFDKINHLIKSIEDCDIVAVREKIAWCKNGD